MSSEDHHGIDIHIIKSFCHDVKDGRRNHGGLIHYNQIVLIQCEVGVLARDDLYWDAEGAVDGVGCDFSSKNLLVRLGQQGNRRSNQDFELFLDAMEDGPYEYLRLSNAGLPQDDTVEGPLVVCDCVYSGTRIVLEVATRLQALDKIWSRWR